jgi:CheY-like chemotaxis protein
VSEQLRGAGYDVTEVVDGRTAIAFLLSVTPDLILLDTPLPDGSGFDLCTRVRSDVLRAHIPIVFLTAQALHQDRIRGLHVGANDYITSPWAQEDLLLRVSNLISLGQEQRAVAHRDLTSKSNVDRRPSVFIICGKPDETFGSRLKAELVRREVKAFLFCEDAKPGEKLHRVMREGVNTHERVVLVCSRRSLDRPGVLNEIEEALAREARESGEAILIPIRLDDYVLDGWHPERSDLALAIRDRVVADFSGATSSDDAFRKGLDSLMSALTLSLVSAGK